MIVSKDLFTVRVARWIDPLLSWGLVPTMGYLHEGHLSLVRQAKAGNDRVAVSIFVNPTQFSPSEDLSNYPRDLSRDLASLEDNGVDLVFSPEESTIYPEEFQTSIIVKKLTQLLEGTSRPTHFEGVTTVVAKLFNIIQPTRAYFGQKDAQQVVVIKRMVADLNFDVDIVVCPIFREVDGMAMSSRNIRLNPEQREAATILYQALETAASALHSGERRGAKLKRIMIDVITAESLARLDYASVADPSTLLDLDHVEDSVLLSLAVYFGDVRLIDNKLIDLTQ